MREDMDKVIVERPRKGYRGRSAPSTVRRARRIDPEDLHRREGMGTRWREHSRYLNENLAPLRSFLRSSIGRPWDKVYSEVCERINRNSAIQLHILQHLTDGVCTDVVQWPDGELLDSRGGAIWQELLVHPRTGVLLRNRAYSRSFRFRDPTPRHTYVTIDEWHQYRRIDGIWYEVELRPLPAHRWDFWDVVLRRKAPQINGSVFEEMYGKPCYAASKRQLNKKEIRVAQLRTQGVK